MDVAVTGAAGHVGGNLVRELIRGGHDVSALVYRDMRALEGTGADLLKGDVTDLSSLEKAFDGAGIVINCAAHISITGEDGGRVDEVNVTGPRNVVQACLTCKVKRLVHFSSVHAFKQDPMDETIDETRPLADTAPCTAYDRSKAAGEREVLEGLDRGLDAIIVNPSAVIGPHDHKLSRMGDVMLRIYHRKLPALVPGGYDWVDVRDIVDGTLAAVERGRTGERYILSGHWLPVRDLARLVGETTGHTPPKLSTPMLLARIGAPFVEGWSRVTGSRPLYTREALTILTGNSKFSHAKASNELGYEPRPTRDTIKDTFEWFREAGWLDRMP